MNFKHLLFASAFLCVPAALFAASNPKATGTFTYISNYGTTATIALTAQQTDPTAFTGKGTLFLQDPVGTLILEVKFVQVDEITHTAWIASQVAEGSNFPGQPVGSWYVNMVVDKGEPGVGRDFIMGSGLGLDPGDGSVAKQAFQMVATKAPAASYQAGPLLITSGNIQVH